MFVKNDSVSTIRHDVEIGDETTEYLLLAGEVREVPAAHATKLILADDRIRLADPEEA